MSGLKKGNGLHKRKKQILIFACILSALLLAVSIFMAVKISDRISFDAPKEDKDPTLSFSFDPEVLLYNGDGKLDVLSGVSVTDKDGNKYTGKITASVHSSGNKYTIRYSANEKGGAVATAERALEVENYSHPSVAFKETDERFLSSELDRLVDKLVASGNLSALDGFGHDISGSIVMKIDSPLTSSGSYTVTFTAENILGDRASCSGIISIEIDPDDKIIQLSETSIRISAGEYFDPYEYLLTIIDPIDGDVTSKVSVIGNVNTMTPGTYEVVYSFTNSRGETYQSASLSVTVD